MSEEESLQFDRAEFDQAPSGTQCAECHRPLTSAYYDVNGHIACEACRYTIEARMNAGSSVGRFTKAAGAGLVAALLGAVIYYAISALTGYEFGLIAIVVGFGVGTAVRWGSNGRGGWKYQALAMALTYLAIVGTYIPPIIQGFREASARQSQPAAPADGSAAPAATPVSVSTADEPAAPPTTGEMMLALAFLLALACVAPFLAGFENVIGIVIIGIGLYEAWKLNRRSELVITGPHMLGRAPAETAVV